MIKGIFTRNPRGEITHFEISGHAQAGPYGSDIVCSAVSALSISAVNGIEALAGFAPEVDIDQENGGYLSVDLLNPVVNREQWNIAQILLENLLMGLQAVQAENETYVSLQTITEK
ncbi:ribosomal-processing cysteine protease Prp [Enterococcus hirae]|jgi:uncharacterized protein YsxB (DUF464 family)|nr:ribosomal-processing cysteine protease Prp [Enterococcaceae bacterium]MCI1919138.1 ribosomal-processing cysteine protease Prp [Enterococcaceae bacterium]MDM8213547.1 ribosomal-processing cysteine protease Prp [Enterococcus hirae]